MKVEIETARNGYLIREEDASAWAVASDDEVEAARQMLWVVNELVGDIGTRHEARRIRIIVLPGDHWLPPKRDTCKHPWVEMSDDGHDPTWRCPCGAPFGLIAPVRRSRMSWRDRRRRVRRTAM